MSAVLGIIIAIQALALLGMAIRHAGIKTDALDADQKRHTAEKQFQETAREFKTYKQRTIYQLSALREDIAMLERDLDACSSPGDRRRRLEQLLRKASDRENGGDTQVLPSRIRAGTVGAGKPRHG